MPMLPHRPSMLRRHDASWIAPRSRSTAYQWARCCASQQNRLSNVRFGSLATISTPSGDVRFTPNSDRHSDMPLPTSFEYRCVDLYQSPKPIFGLTFLKAEFTMTDTMTRAVERSVQTASALAPASIMVHVDFDADCDKRIRLAADWAGKFNAALIGVAGWVPGREVGGWFAAELERPEQRADRILAEIDKLGARFRDCVGRTVRTVEWRGSFHFPREFIPSEARVADLVVISSHAASEDVYNAFDPGSVILSAGRPVLVVPDGAASCSGEQILVAWKDTREARHAVQNALPYLEMAKQVTLLTIVESIVESAARNQLDDVEKYLLRHQISVGKKIVLEPKGLASDQLMNVAKSDGADLIVAGAYGHTRLGEWIFGGVTRGLLQKSNICCLFFN